VWLAWWAKSALEVHDDETKKPAFKAGFFVIAMANWQLHHLAIELYIACLRQLSPAC
jgi:hypothetical protein